MENKSKLAIFDLDGTLFDTKDVNYKAYSQALKDCGFVIEIDYKYYCEFCNGNSYKVFLPKMVPDITEDSMQRIHDRKKILYARYLRNAKKNQHLFSLIQLIKKEYQVAIVTTASRKNVDDILDAFGVTKMFDFEITQEDVGKTKPDPEGFLLAIKRAGVNKSDTLIFEDSDTGIEAARRSGINFVKVYGYN